MIMIKRISAIALFASLLSPNPAAAQALREDDLARLLPARPKKS